MFRNRTTKRVTALVGASAGLWIAAVGAGLHTASFCEYQQEMELTPLMPTTEMAAQCSQSQVPSEHVSWSSWATGQSSSFQFHFLDLLELLYGSESEFSGQ